MLPLWIWPANFPSIISHLLKLSFGRDSYPSVHQEDHIKTRCGRNSMLAMTIPFCQRCAVTQAIKASHEHLSKCNIWVTVWVNNEHQKTTNNKTVNIFFITMSKTIFVQISGTKKTTEICLWVGDTSPRLMAENRVQNRPLGKVLSVFELSAEETDLRGLVETCRISKHNTLAKA